MRTTWLHKTTNKKQWFYKINNKEQMNEVTELLVQNNDFYKWCTYEK